MYVMSNICNHFFIVMLFYFAQINMCVPYTYVRSMDGVDKMCDGYP